VSQALSDAFESMKKRYKPANLKAAQKTFYFSLGDAPDQKWVMTLTPQACEVKPGKVDNADVVLKTSEELFLKLIRGEWVPGAMDFMRGKIKANDIDGLKLLKDCFV
jgi:putative sterol carrier protein